MATTDRRKRGETGRTTPPRSGASGNGSNVRVPPHSLGAEEALLGALLLSRHAVADVVGTITADDFYKPAHGHIYGAICSLYAQDQPVEPISVSEELGRTQLLEAIGGPATLVTLLANAPSTTNAGHYARMVVERAVLRHAVGLAGEVAEAAYDGDLEGVQRWLTEGAEHLAPGHLDAGTWALVDLAGVISDGLEPEQPTLLARDDGVKLLYPGRVHAFNAESESGKSWAALLACKQELEVGGHVLYVDFEDSAAGVAGRLLAMGSPTHDIVERFHYVRPDDPITETAKAAVMAILRSAKPSICVLDGVTEAMALSGWSIIDNDDIAVFFAALARPIARMGTTVILIDHVGKDRDARGKDAIGGQHKRAGIDGASYMFDVVKPFGRGMAGLSRVTVTKDRHGAVREVARAGTTIGELHVIGLAGGGVSVGLRAPMTADSDGKISRPTIYLERVSRAIEDANTAGVKPSVRKVTELVHGKRDHIIEALKLLVLEGHVTITNGPRKTIAHVIAKPYRQVDDPLSPEYQGPAAGPFDPHANEEF